jgi:hypothetical protein
MHGLYMQLGGAGMSHVGSFQSFSTALNEAGRVCYESGKLHEFAVIPERRSGMGFLSQSLEAWTAVDALNIARRLKDEGKTYGSFLFTWRAIRTAERQDDEETKEIAERFLMTLA